MIYVEVLTLDWFTLSVMPCGRRNEVVARKAYRVNGICSFVNCEAKDLIEERKLSLADRAL